MSKFKVGDKVKIIATKYLTIGNKTQLGWTGVIIHNDLESQPQFDYLVKINEQHDAPLIEWYYNEEDLSLINSILIKERLGVK